MVAASGARNPANCATMTSRVAIRSAASAISLRMRASRQRAMLKSITPANTRKTPPPIAANK